MTRRPNYHAYVRFLDTPAKPGGDQQVHDADIYINRNCPGENMEFASATAGGVVMRQYFSSHLLAGAGKLAELAKQIESRHSGEPKFDLEHRGYVLSSIVSSAGFLESMINELFQDAHDGHAPEGGAVTSLSTCTIRSMSEYWQSTEKGKGKKAATLEKYQALLCSAGKPILDRGERLYQDAALVVRLRNIILHFHPEDLPASNPQTRERALRTIEAELGARKFNDNRLMMGSGNTWWPDKCLGFGCAQWALRAVTNLTDHIVDAVQVRPNYVVHRATGWLGNVPGASDNGL